MAPAEHDVVQSAAGCVNTMFGAVYRVVDIPVGREGFVAVDDALIECTADGECVANNIPLAFSVEEKQKLTQIVDQGL